MRMISYIRNKWMLIIAMLFVLQVTFTPIYAKEVQVVAPNDWASAELDEGQNYGIFPITWYDKEFQKPISAAKLTKLLQAVSQKIEAVGLQKRTEMPMPQFQGALTRKKVITYMYHIFTRYQWPPTIAVDKYQPLSYFQQAKIIKGTGHHLALDKPCTVEEAVVLATRLIAHTYVAVEAGGEGFLWKVSHKNNTMYILGSVHIGDPKMYPFHPRIKKAFKRADQLIVEVDTSKFTSVSASSSLLRKYLTYCDGTTLKDHVSVETYNKVQQVLQKLNISSYDINHFTPLGIMESVAANIGVDSYFLHLAHKQGKEVQELESLEFQLTLLDAEEREIIEQANHILDPKYQEQRLNKVLDQMGKTDVNTTEMWEKIKDIQAYWTRGDIANLRSILLAEQDASYQKLFGDRDKAMTNKLVERLQQAGKKTYFVVVGAGHVVWDNSIIHQLKQRGFTVQLMNTTDKQ